MVKSFGVTRLHTMELITILNRCHRFRGFVYHQARFTCDHKNIEISVRPRKRSAAICSRCHQPASGYPVWAHTGKIMFSGYGGGKEFRLFEVDPDGSHLSPAPAFEPGDSEPVWTPDGCRVVFGRDTGVAVADTATGQVCHALPGTRAIQWTIAPDGQSIAYACQLHGANAGFEVFVCDLNRQSTHQLVSNPIVHDHEVDSRYVSWSPWL